MDVNGEHVKLLSTMQIGRRTLETSECSFAIGEAFEGSLGMMGPFRGHARWLQVDTSIPASSEEPPKGLLVERCFSVNGKEVIMEETYQPTLEGRMTVEMCIKGQGEMEIEIASVADRNILCRCLDKKTLCLKKDAELSTGVVLRCGKVIGLEALTAISTLSSIAVPAQLKIQYPDVRCTTVFNLAGGGRPATVEVSSATKKQPLPLGSHQRNIDNSVLLEGFVWKRSRHLRKWRKRWLTLTAEELKFFDDAKNVTEVIPTRSLRRASCAGDMYPNCMCLDINRRSFYLSFEEDMIKQRWLQELTACMSQPRTMGNP